MRLSLLSSLLLHGGLIAWALAGFQDAKPFVVPEPPPVEVATITEDGLTRLMQGERNSKIVQAALAKPTPPSEAVKETPKAKPPEPSAPPPPPEPAKPEPVKVEPPKPEPPKPEPAKPEPAKVEPAKPPEPQKDEIAELARQAEAEAAAKAKAEAAAKAKADADAAAKARAEAAAKARAEAAAKAKAAAAAAAAKAREDAKKKPKDDFFTDMEKEFVDKDKSKRAPQPTGSQVASASNVKGPQAGAPEGKDRVLTGSEVGVISAIMGEMIRRCFSPPAGAEASDKVVVQMEVRLSPNGQITAQPKVVSRIATPGQGAMADFALRALVQCQPYTRLPPHLYKGGWDHMIVDFNPRS